MVICFEDDPKIGYLQKFILFLSALRQSEVAITTKECFILVDGLVSFFYFIIVSRRKIIKNLNKSNFFLLKMIRLVYIFKIQFIN